jgi:uncharacterized glyoxalase superfamily protein PhnB
MGRAAFDQINIVARDMAATLAFYQCAGVEMPDAGADGRAAHHVRVETAAAGLEFDSHALAKAYIQGFAAERTRVVIGLKLETREDVDETWQRLVTSGAQSLQAPCDAFWGARYAIVEDPDGNAVGLMSPMDPGRRSAPAL